MLPATAELQKISGAVFLPGLWWMDGNSFPEEVTSAYPIKSASAECPGSDCILDSPLYATRAWAFTDSNLGRFILHAIGADVTSIAHVRWENETYAEAIITEAKEKVAFIKVSDDH